MKKIQFLILGILTLLNLNSLAQFNEYYPEVKWFTIETEHFSVHFHEGAERTAKVVAKIAEEIYEPITDMYGYRPERVHFVIKDIDDYSNGATYFFDNKIEIWAPPLDTDLRGTHHWLRNVISHEFTHMVQLQAAMKARRTIPAFYFQILNYERERRPDVLYGFPNVIVSYPIPMINVPQWFAEGTAQYMRHEFEYDFWDSHRDMILRMYVLDDKMLTWNQMTVFDKTSLGNESVYNSGFALVSYIAMTYGEEKLIEINNQLKNKLSFTIEEAIKKVLNKSGKELYEEWKQFLKNYYLTNTHLLRENLFEGELIESDGFGNFYPVFHPMENKIFYLSNKNEDYFLTSIYAYDLNTKKSELIVSGVSSTFSITPDGEKLIYSRLTEKNKNLVKIHDIYIYDLRNKKEKRLTRGLRANNPSVSPDGKTIVFTSQKDGTINLFLIDIDGKDYRQLTYYKNGEQLFNPRFSTNGNKIIFDYSLNESRDIAICDLDGNIDFILNEVGIDERNPFFINDEEFIYSTDKKGIYNIFVYNLKTKTSRQITNVLGGAFMPAANHKGELTYSGYTSTGYKIFFIDKYDNRDFSELPNYNYRIFRVPFEKRKNGNYNWEAFKNFDDTQVPNFHINPYKGNFTKLSIIPFVRYDNYSRTAKGVELIKPGFYFYSSDILNRSGIFGSVAINSRFERDVYIGLEYRDRLPVLFSLGLKPELNLELYSVSRKTEAVLGLLPDTLSNGIINYGYKTPVNITYNLFEVDFSAKHYLFSKSQTIQFRTSYSRYSADLGAFFLPNYILYPASYEVYLKGWTFNLIYNFEKIALKKDSDINPYGTRINLNLEYSSNDFNPESYYDEDEGTLLTRYAKTKYSRIELNLMQAFKLPFGKHSLTLKTRAGTTLGPQTDNFFDFYLGGLIGMKSYPFYAISGNEIFHLNVNYRFPVYENIDKRLYHLYIDKIYASLYFDFGNAWESKFVKLNNFKKGIGAELRAQMNSFYIFPTSLFLNVAYGFDEFNRTNVFTKETIKYGKEFLIYFGILFGFEI